MPARSRGPVRRYDTSRCARFRGRVHFRCQPHPLGEHRVHNRRIEGVHLGARQRQVIAGLAQRQRLSSPISIPAFSTRASCASECPMAAFSLSMPAAHRRRRLVPVVAFASGTSPQSAPCRSPASRRSAARCRGCCGTRRSRDRRSGCACSARTSTRTRVWHVPQTLAMASTPGGAAPWLPWQSLQVGADRSLRSTIASMSARSSRTSRADRSAARAPARV